MTKMNTFTTANIGESRLLRNEQKCRIKLSVNHMKKKLLLQNYYLQQFQIN